MTARGYGLRRSLGPNAAPKEDEGRILGVVGDEGLEPPTSSL